MKVLPAPTVEFDNVVVTLTPTFAKKAVRNCRKRTAMLMKNYESVDKVVASKELAQNYKRAGSVVKALRVEQLAVRQAIACLNRKDYKSADHPLIASAEELIELVSNINKADPQVDVSVADTVEALIGYEGKLDADIKVAATRLKRLARANGEFYARAFAQKGVPIGDLYDAGARPPAGWDDVKQILEESDPAPIGTATLDPYETTKAHIIANCVHFAASRHYAKAMKAKESRKPNEKDEFDELTLELKDILNEN